MHYTATAPFTGDPARAIDVAVSILAPVGFRIDEKTASEVRLTGPGMNSNRQNPLVGASSIHLVASRTELALAAELGGVRRMSRFVIWFPLILCLVLFGIGAAVAAIKFPQQLQMVLTIAAIPVGINILLWLILGPIISRHLKRKTCEALDVLLSNLTKM